MIALAWVIHIGPEKWLAAQLKSTLAGPQNAAISAKSLLMERFAGTSVKAIPASVMPAVVPATVSSVAATRQTLQSPTSSTSLTNESGAL
jgi:hypothetical protein